jgi:hypothetical protein
MELRLYNYILEYLQQKYKLNGDELYKHVLKNLSYKLDHFVNNKPTTQILKDSYPSTKLISMNTVYQKSKENRYRETSEMYKRTNNQIEKEALRKELSREGKSLLNTVEEAELKKQMLNKYGSTLKEKSIIDMVNDIMEQKRYVRTLRELENEKYSTTQTNTRIPDKKKSLKNIVTGKFKGLIRRVTNPFLSRKGKTTNLSQTVVAGNNAKPSNSGYHNHPVDLNKPTKIVEGDGNEGTQVSSPMHKPATGLNDRPDNLFGTGTNGIKRPPPPKIKLPTFAEAGISGIKDTGSLKERFGNVNPSHLEQFGQPITSTEEPAKELHLNELNLNDPNINTQHPVSLGGSSRNVSLNRPPPRERLGFAAYTQKVLSQAASRARSAMSMTASSRATRNRLHQQARNAMSAHIRNERHSREDARAEERKKEGNSRRTARATLNQSRKNASKKLREERHAREKERATSRKKQGNANHNQMGNIESAKVRANRHARAIENI